MEQCVNGFMRVLRHIDDANHITKLIIDIECHPQSNLSARDELGVLDFPEKELDANVGKSTSLSRADLLQ